MKKKLVLSGIAVLAVLLVCVANLGKEKEMPPVLFSFLYRYDYFSVWTIDNEGNIYRFHNRDGLYLDMTDYENKKKDESCKYIKIIDAEIVREKYADFQKVLAAGNYKKNLREGIEMVTGEYKGTQNYYGYTFNRKGEEEHILMRGAGSTEYLSEDSRMKELADWMEELLREDLWEYDQYCRELKMGEYYQEYVGRKATVPGADGDN